MSTVNILLVTAGEYNVQTEFTNPTNVQTVNVPPNMVCNRVTFFAGINTLLQPTALLVNNRVPLDTTDGVIIIPQYDVTNNILYPSKYTFENFNGEEITETFYLANIGFITADPANFFVLFEGYQR
jgi:hypothetical protein